MREEDEEEESDVLIEVQEWEVVSSQK